MKRYTALRFIAGVWKFIGWVVLNSPVLAVVLALVFKAPLPVEQSGDMGLVSLAVLASFVAAALIGIGFIAFGQLLSAVADMASNSAYLRRIAESADRTANTGAATPRF